MALRGWGDMIREARERKNWTQAEWAERMRTSTGTVSRWENERLEPNTEQTNDIVVSLSLSMEEFLRARGFALTPPAAARLPRALVMGILALPPERLASLTELLAPLPNGVSPGFGQR